MVNKSAHAASIRDFLVEITRPLAEFLNTVLPRISQNWWQKNVFDILTEQQQQRARVNKIKSLFHLDLSALLRVLVKNWHYISENMNLSFDEGKNYINEMRTIRNKWAHISSATITIEDLYRDIDTIHRFCILINANNKTIDEVNAIRLMILYNEDNHQNLQKNQESQKQPKINHKKIISENTHDTPQYYELFSQVLKILSDDKPRTSHEIILELGIIMSYSESILSNIKEKDTIGWCTWHLKTAGLVNRPSRGINIITNSGKDFLKKYEIITRDELKTIPAYVAKLKK